MHANTGKTNARGGTRCQLAPASTTRVACFPSDTPHVYIMQTIYLPLVHAVAYYALSLDMLQGETNALTYAIYTIKAFLPSTILSLSRFSYI